jgi:AcrR family transcriptional regulator
VSPAEHPVPVAAGKGPGRPRLHEPDDERRLLMDAAVEVLRRNHGQDATVAEILAEAGVSTRAFYRHFDSKEEVVRALYQRDAESFGAHIRHRLDQAGSPAAALEAWVDEILGLAYDRRRSERMASFSSAMVGRIVAGTKAERLGVELLLEPLREVLEAGQADGSLAMARPELDMHTIRAVTFEAIGWARLGHPRLTRTQAVAHVLRFILPALGAA